MGFKFLKNHAHNHAALIESPYILNWRKGYLYAIFEFKKAGRRIYYFDESYENSNHTPDRILTDTTIVSAKYAEEHNYTTGMYFANRGIFLLLFFAGYVIEILYHILDFEVALILICTSILRYVRVNHIIDIIKSIVCDSLPSGGKKHVMNE